MSDVYSKKKMLFWGMLIQGFAIISIIYTTGFLNLIFIAAALGFGTALVYPTFLSAIASTTTPTQRAESIDVFRLWRDLGYAVGAIISGIIADIWGIEYAILSIGMITILSSIVIKFRMTS
jgi:MFS family permease